MKVPSISCLREKSFRKFTFAAGDILLPGPALSRPSQNPFKAFELPPGPVSPRSNNQQLRAKNYKSCEKTAKGSPRLQKQDSEGGVPAKLLKSCKSLSSTEHDDEIDLEEKRVIEAERPSPPTLSCPAHQSTIKMVQNGSGSCGPCQPPTKLSGLLTLSKHSSRSSASSGVGRVRQFKVVRFRGRAQVFEIVRFLDRGSFGEVFLVRHVLTKMLFCLKTVNRSKLSEKAFEQLVQEVKIQISLNHPSIVKLYAFAADASNIYLLLEACLGQSLYRAARDSPLQEGVVREHLRRVCEAVEHLHEQHIIHRDIKAENILLEGGNAKLCDFGWATHSPLLRSTKCGTPVYTPPEMVRMQQYGNKVDLWCIGVLTYELLFNALPFEIRYMQDFAKITHQQVVFPKNPQVSDEAKSFISLCLAKEAEKRIDIKQALAHDFLTKKLSESKPK